MNTQQFKECWDQLKGPLKRDWVKITEDDLGRISGDQMRFQGIVQVRYGPMDGEISKWADRWYARWIGWYEGYEEAVTTA
jgi:uncharacterized protein YjbJ (UPF0337 family)